MKALRTVLLTASIAALTLALPMSAHAEGEPIVITYSVEATIASTGAIEVVETITTAEGVEPISIMSEMASWSSPDGGAPSSISDPLSSPLDDRSVVREFDVTTGPLRVFSAADLEQDNPLGFNPGDVEFYAEVIGPLPGATIEQARLEITTPGEVLAAACFVEGRSIPTCVDRFAANQATFATKLIPPGESMVIAMVFDGSQASIESPPTNVSALEGPWPWVIAALGVGIGALAGALWARRAKRASEDDDGSVDGR